MTFSPHPSQQTAVDLDGIGQGFRAIADPLRLQIIELLRTEEICVCDLCERLGVAQSKLSFHLKTLKDAKLVTARQDGRWMYYRLNFTQFARLRDYLGDFQGVPSIKPATPCS